MTNDVIVMGLKTALEYIYNSYNSFIYKEHQIALIRIRRRCTSIN